MSQRLVPPDFDVPTTYQGSGFHLEVLGPIHNERDHQAWMSSIDHIRATPGMDWGSWPAPMSLEANLGDMEMHHREFVDREAFTYSILDGDSVIGCVYIYPAKDGRGAHVRSWVTKNRAEMDEVVWRELSHWLETEWPLEGFYYAPRA